MGLRPIAFVGAGNMAGAMVDGLLRRDASSAAQLRCLGGGGASATALAARTGIARAASYDELLGGADTVVLAFKPQHLASADSRLRELAAGKLIISVLAGKRLARLAGIFPNARNIVRVMPNTPSRIGAGMSGWSVQSPLSVDDRAMLMEILEALGDSIEIDEAQMDALTAVSGSGPAFVFEFAAALRDAGVAAGLDVGVAEKLSVATVRGAGLLMGESKADPETLRKQVTSPNGTTFAGLRCLENGGFRSLIRETVLAAKARSEELSRDA